MLVTEAYWNISHSIRGLFLDFNIQFLNGSKWFRSGTEYRNILKLQYLFKSGLVLISKIQLQKSEPMNLTIVHTVMFPFHTSCQSREIISMKLLLNYCQVIFDGYSKGYES